MMGPTIAKKGNFDGLHNYLKNHFGTKFPFLVILMEPTITKKRNFDGQHNNFDNHFEINKKNLVTLMDYININGTHNY